MQQRASPWTTLGITSLAVFAVNLDALVLFVAFPSIQQQFATASSASLSWVLNGYTIVYGALLVPAGRLADRIGRKRLFLLGVAVFGAASIACAASPSLGWLVGLRIVQGVGGACLAPTSLALSLAAFPPPRRPVAVTLWAAVGALAVLIGPPLGSVVVHLAGWRGIFLLNIPISVAAWVLGRAALNESRDESRGALPDFPGTALLIAAVALLAYGVVERHGPALLLGLAAGAAFFWRSSRTASPAFDLGLFRDRNFSRANAGLFVFSVAFSGLFLNSVLFLTRVWHYSLVQTGLAVMPGPLMVVALAPLAGRVASARGHRVLLLPGGVTFAAGSLLLLSLATAAPRYLTLYLPATLLGGVGVALVLPILSSAALRHVPASELGAASGVATAIRQFGAVLGVATVIALLGRAPDTIAPFSHVWRLMIACGVVVSLISLGIDAPPSPRVAQPEYRS